MKEKYLKNQPKFFVGVFIKKYVLILIMYVKYELLCSV